MTTLVSLKDDDRNEFYIDVDGISFLYGEGDDNSEHVGPYHLILKFSNSANNLDIEYRTSADRRVDIVKILKAVNNET